MSAEADSGVWAVLVAAGRGERFGGDRPKAFANLAGRPLLAESLERLEASDWVEAVVLVVPPEWEEPSILLAEELGAGKVHAAVPGAATRAGSVRAGVAEVPEGAAVIVVHDAARPLLSTDVLERVVTALGDGWDGAVPALALDDTVKRASGEAVAETVDRDRALRHADAAGLPRPLAPARARGRPRCDRLRRPRRGGGRPCPPRGGRSPASEGDHAHGPRVRRVPARGRRVIVDYHMHLRGPADGREGPVELTVTAVERFVERAAARGVDEIAFTEHMYYFRQAEPLLAHPYQRGRVAHDLDDYCAAVLDAKAQGLPVKLAIELEWLPGRERELAELLRPYPWDFVLGSVHLLDGEAVDLQPGIWGELPVEDVWRRYFVELGGLARSGLADVLAHPDLVKIFGRRPSPETVAACHDEAAAAVAEGGAAVEVSTAGLRKPVGELYPDAAFLARCRERGVGATLASDAHVAADVGRDFDAGVEHLRAAGYGTITVLTEREARQEELG